MAKSNKAAGPQPFPALAHAEPHNHRAFGGPCAGDPRTFELQAHRDRQQRERQRREMQRLVAEALDEQKRDRAVQKRERRGESSRCGA